MCRGALRWQRSRMRLAPLSTFSEPSKDEWTMNFLQSIIRTIGLKEVWSRLSSLRISKRLHPLERILSSTRYTQTPIYNTFRLCLTWHHMVHVDDREKWNLEMTARRRAWPALLLSPGAGSRWSVGEIAPAGPGSSLASCSADKSEDNTILADVISQLWSPEKSSDFPPRHIEHATSLFWWYRFVWSPRWPHHQQQQQQQQPKQGNLVLLTFGICKGRAA